MHILKLIRRSVRKRGGLKILSFRCAQKLLIIFHLALSIEEQKFPDFQTIAACRVYNASMTQYRLSPNHSD
jgi:hypothetical protein